MVLQTRPKSHEIGKVKWKKLGSDLAAQSSRLVATVQVFELYDMGMVPGAGFFKGRGKGSSFGIMFWFVPGRTKIEKQKMSQKWVLSIPKDAARLRDLGKRVFGPKFPNKC